MDQSLDQGSSETAGSQQVLDSTPSNNEHGMPPTSPVRQRRGSLLAIYQQQLHLYLENLSHCLERGLISGTMFSAALLSIERLGINRTRRRRPVPSRVVLSLIPTEELPDECSICFKHYPMKKAVYLDCGHKFHANCIRHWIRISNTCPLCRDSLA